MAIIPLKISSTWQHLKMQNTSDNITADTLEPRSKKAFIGYCIMFLASLVFCVGAQFAIPAFEDLFSSFGADLPWLTSAVVSYKWLLLILPVYLSVMTIILLTHPTVKNESNKIFNIMFMIDLLTLLSIIGLVIYALYLPVFNMGKVV